MLAPQPAQGLVARGSVKPGRGVLGCRLENGSAVPRTRRVRARGVSTPQEASRSAPEDYRDNPRGSAPAYPIRTSCVGDPKKPAETIPR